MQRPKIGYTTRNFSLDPLQIAIHISIYLAGGRPVRLSPRAPKYDEPLHGLIIGGGTDLYPALYDIDPKPNYHYDQERDALEIRWFDHAQQANMPILGICRGAQLINIQRGGTLHPDISKIYDNAQYPSSIWANIFYRKRIYVQPGSLLNTLLISTQTTVNSIHKQAIDKLGDRLAISAQEENGVVQAIEDKGHNYLLGVQFHPELLIHKSKFRNIFNHLIDTARKKL